MEEARSCTPVASSTGSYKLWYPEAGMLTMSYDKAETESWEKLPREIANKAR